MSNNTTNSIFNLTREGNLEPKSIEVPVNLTANIYLNNNWEKDITAEFAGVGGVNCPAGEITLLYTMGSNSGNVGLTDYINLQSETLSGASSLVWIAS
ncbi:MAG: hypothetical protein COA38_13485 [Fluviicola sp.]|nr:MAG: hypothetical protein COA38_13485 [Fluviicola sp.]